MNDIKKYTHCCGICLKNPFSLPSEDQSFKQDRQHLKDTLLPKNPDFITPSILLPIFKPNPIKSVFCSLTTHAFIRLHTVGPQLQSPWRDAFGCLVCVAPHAQAACNQCVVLREWVQGDPLQHTLWSESGANPVWHLWRPWDNLHDTATDRSRDIDLKSGGSKIRFLCVMIGPEARTSVVT